jgi:heterodisulfide reductase subunit A
MQTEINGKKVAKVNESNCKGCGMCTPVCPTDAIDLAGYTNAQIESMIDALAEA